MIYTWFLTNGMKLGGVLAMVAVIWLHGCHYGADGEKENTHKVQVAFNTFVTKTNEAGEAAAARAKATEAADKLKKEKADAENLRTITELRDAVARMRLARARSSYLPEPTTTAGSPEDITFDRAGLEREIQRLDARVQELIVEGSEAQRKLDIAVKWAAEWASGEKN